MLGGHDGENVVLVDELVMNEISGNTKETGTGLVTVCGLVTACPLCCMSTMLNVALS